MGTIIHKPIIITSWNTESMDDIADMCAALELDYHKQSKPSINNIQTIIIFPSGSKEGWEDAERFEKKKFALKQYMEEYRYKDNSMSVNWVEVHYSSDMGGAEIAESWYEPYIEEEEY